MLDLYHNIYKDFEIKNTQELCSVNYSKVFNNYKHIENSAKSLVNTLHSDILTKRRDSEIEFHTFLSSQLFSHLIEMKAYSKVDISDTRRFISVSSDCISTIQMLIRDKIYLNIYFRSSDFDNVLPIDLEFLCKLPRKLIEHLLLFKENIGYEEVSDKLIRDLSIKEVKLSLMFGSLHMTK